MSFGVGVAPRSVAERVAAVVDDGMGSSVVLVEKGKRLAAVGKAKLAVVLAEPKAVALVAAV